MGETRVADKKDDREKGSNALDMRTIDQGKERDNECGLRGLELGRGVAGGGGEAPGCVTDNIDSPLDTLALPFKESPNLKELFPELGSLSSEVSVGSREHVSSGVATEESETAAFSKSQPTKNSTEVQGPKTNRPLVSSSSLPSPSDSPNCAEPHPLRRFPPVITQPSQESPPRLRTQHSVSTYQPVNTDPRSTPIPSPVVPRSLKGASSSTSDSWARFLQWLLLLDLHIYLPL